MGLALPNGVSQIDPKYHHLVGKNILKYPAEPDGLCQNTSKAASLFSDPRRGKDIAEEENRYLLKHFEHFKHGYAWPHTIIIGSGEQKRFENEEEFKHFLANNPQASYMWGDHQQLQITSNIYQAKVNVLTIDSKGNGSIMKTPCTPDPALKEFSVLPVGTDVKDIWLLYTNGNHYDALIAVDDQLITIGSIEDIEKTDVINKEKPTNDNEKKEKFPCQKCQRVFEKEKARDLHMNREHNTKSHQYTPGLAKRKVGRPTTRFTCAECKNNLGNENDLRKHMMIVHNNHKRTRSEIKLEPLQRVASITKSPPKKRVKEVESNKNSDTKDIIISNLETRNATLVEVTERKQEMINKQATIIGGLRADLEQATLALEVRDATITELNRAIGTTSNEEDVPPVGGQDKAGPPANLAIPSGETPGAPLNGDKSAGQEKGDERFLADEGRWENMGTNEDKRTQKHCALDSRGPDDCTFQCNSKKELDRHVNEKHMFTCTVCPRNFKEIYGLASHIEKDHKNEINQSHEINSGSKYKCNRCASSFTTKRELTTHIKEKHKTYKPCDYFIETRCELDDDCNFYHVILAQGQHICYTCGDIFKSKRDLINHIKEKHGNTVCYKFLQNKCTVRRCFFKHIIQSAPNVGKTSEAPPAPTYQDFPSLPTTGPVVWNQVAAKDTQPRDLPHLLDGTQNKNKALEAQVLQTLTQMMPQITQQLMAALKTGMTTN